VAAAIKAGLCYFALTFGAGFLLGPLGSWYWCRGSARGQPNWQNCR